MAKFPVGSAADLGDAVPADYWQNLGEIANASYFNVKQPDFGAVGNGTTDDRAAIQACIDASLPGDVIIFPSGFTYGIGAPVVYKPFRAYVTTSPGWLDQTVIKALNGTSANFQSTSGHSGLFVPESWNNNATTASGPFYMSGLAFNGNKANNATGQHHGLIIYGEYWWKLLNIRSFQNKRSGIALLTTAKNGVATMASGLSDGQFENIWVNLNDEHGVWQDTPTSNHTDVVWSGSNRFFDNVQSGIWCDNPAGWEFNNLHLSNNGQHSVYFLDASFSVKINGLYSENHGTTAAAATSYFGLRAGINNGEPLEVVNATIRTLEPAGTSSFTCFALEGTENDAHAYLTNCHAMGAGTARGHGFNYNAGSTLKLTVHEAGVGAVGFAAGQDKEVIGVGAMVIDPPRIFPGFTSQAGTAYTLTYTDAGQAVEFTSASSVTVTVPPNSSVAFPIGTVVEIARMGAGSVTVAAGAGVTVRTPGTLVLRALYSTVSLRKKATDEWLLAGDTT